MELEIQKECAICLEDVPSLCVLSCRHRFCKLCIDAIIKSSEEATCPLCRATIANKYYKVDVRAMLIHIRKIDMIYLNHIFRHYEGYVKRILYKYWRGILLRLSLQKYSKEQINYLTKCYYPYWTHYQAIPFEVSINASTQELAWSCPMHDSRKNSTVVITHCKLAREIEKKAKEQFEIWSKSFNQLAEPVFIGIDVNNTMVTLENDIRMSLVHYAIYESDDWHEFSRVNDLLDQYHQLDEAFKRGIKNVASIKIDKPKRELKRKRDEKIDTEFLDLISIALYRVIKTRKSILKKEAHTDAYKMVSTQDVPAFRDVVWTELEPYMLRNYHDISVVGETYLYRM
jgi:hypothetical protein